MKKHERTKVMCIFCASFIFHLLHACLHVLDFGEHSYRPILFLHERTHAAERCIGLTETHTEGMRHPSSIMFHPCHVPSSRRTLFLHIFIASARFQLGAGRFTFTEWCNGPCPWLQPYPEVMYIVCSKLFKTRQ